MTDIVERLRVAGKKYGMSVMREAADEIQRLRGELAEADRRAGEAERHNAELKRNASARQLWLSKAKKEWGVDDSVSFDVIWAKALTLRAELANWRAAGERAAADRARELDACPYCRKHGEHAYSPCYLHGGCAEAKVEVLENGMFKFTCPVCGVESGKVREQQKEIERLRAELATAKALLNEVLPWVGYWDRNNDALRLYQSIRAALSDQPAPPNTSNKP